MAERAGGELDARSAMSWMATEAASGHAGAGEFGGGDLLKLDHAGVEDVDGVTLAEEEAVMGAAVVFKAQKAEEERGHQVGGGH